VGTPLHEGPGVGKRGPWPRSRPRRCYRPRQRHL